MPPVTAVPMPFMAPAPAPVARASGKVPKKNAREVIMTAEADSHRRQGRRDQALPLPHLRLDELDDQDGVLGRKPQGGQEDDLE